ncbi:DUF4834 family protein [Pedobacter sp. P351]|uniref:DUF4834 family protein n=1 Tax=Pedobacter superstes TaxID=3133441 RepID=UPI0030B213D6
MVLKFIIITILVLWIIKMIARVLLPVLFKKMVSKAQEHVNSQYRQQEQPRRPVGKLHVDYVPPKDKEARAADRAGDFIDYEEIKL